MPLRSCVAVLLVMCAGLCFASMAASNSSLGILQKESNVLVDELEANQSTSKSDSKEVLCHGQFMMDWSEGMRSYVSRHFVREVLVHKKRFIRFLVNVTSATSNNSNETLTLVSVMDSFDYVRHYPHNFQTLSLGSFSILTANIHNMQGHCNSSCGGNCGTELLLKEMSEFVVEIEANLTSNLTQEESLKLKFDPVCVQIDYDVSDVLSNHTEDYDSDILSLNIRDYALPDLLYYWRFLKHYLTWTPHKRYIYSGDAHKDVMDLPNYRCYVTGGTFFVDNLLTHYGVIIGIGMCLWLYSPLLIHFFPSASLLSDCPNGMFPRYKSPVYFGRLVQWLMCYYVSDESFASLLLVRTRRILFFLLVSSLSFRLLLFSQYRYWCVTMLGLMLASAWQPRYLSRHVQTELPKEFVLFFTRWTYPKGLIKTPHGKKLEYQMLAHVMQERAYLTIDLRFWKHLFIKSFEEKSGNKSNGMFLAWCNYPIRRLRFFMLCSLRLSLSVIAAIVYFAVPLLFFSKEMMQALWRCRHDVVKSGHLCTANRWVRIVITTVHGVMLVLLLPWVLLQLFVLCLFITEAFIFTCFGLTLTPSGALKYATSFGSILFGLYTMVHHLHESCNAVLNEVVAYLLSSEKLEKLVSDLGYEPVNVRLTNTTGGGEQCVFLANSSDKTSNQLCLLKNDGTTTYISKEMYFSVLEAINPVRRQILLLLVKVAAMLFFVMLVYWVKNVYHVEENLSELFFVADSLAVFFIPGLLQLLADKGTFGKRAEEILTGQVHRAIVEYIRDLSPTTSTVSTISYTTVRNERKFGRSLS